MKTKESRFIDKTQWARGLWDSEPDKIQWEDATTGLPCLAVRNSDMGNWCGYVGVAADHPWFEKSYDDDIIKLDCHGDLTYSGFCEEDKEHGICHQPDPDEPDRVWWFGFDCSHAYDLAPGLNATLKKCGGKPWPGDVYRSLAYVQKECTELARQLGAPEAQNIFKVA